MTQSDALTSRPDALQRVTDTISRVSKAAALMCGALFLPLAFYMTFDAVSRRLGGPFTGTSDEIASYVLALGGTWVLASALAHGAHVRIDILMGFYPRRMRAVIDAWAFLMTMLFAAVLTWQATLLAEHSFIIGARSFSLLGIPLMIPQALTAIGFFMLTVQSFCLLLIVVLGRPLPHVEVGDQLQP